MNLDLGGVDCAFCVRGDCGVLGGFLAWERGRGAGKGVEGGGVSFSDGGFGREYRPFSFCEEDVDGSSNWSFILLLILGLYCWFCKVWLQFMIIEFQGCRKRSVHLQYLIFAILFDYYYKFY